MLTVEELRELVGKRYKSGEKGGYYINEDGYLAVFGKPNFDDMLTSINEWLSKHPEDKNDLSALEELVIDRMSTYQVYSRG